MKLAGLKKKTLVSAAQSPTHTISGTVEHLPVSAAAPEAREMDVKPTSFHIPGENVTSLVSNAMEIDTASCHILETSVTSASCHVTDIDNSSASCDNAQLNVTTSSIVSPIQDSLQQTQAKCSLSSHPTDISNSVSAPVGSPSAQSSDAISPRPQSTAIDISNSDTMLSKVHDTSHKRAESMKEEQVSTPANSIHSVNVCSRTTDEIPSAYTSSISSTHDDTTSVTETLPSEQSENGGDATSKPNSRESDKGISAEPSLSSVLHEPQVLSDSTSPMVISPAETNQHLSTIVDVSSERIATEKAIGVHRQRVKTLKQQLNAELRVCLSVISILLSVSQCHITFISIHSC